MKKTLLIISIFFCLLSLHAEEGDVPRLSYKKLTEEESEARFGMPVLTESSSFHGHFSLIATNFPPNEKFKLYCRNLIQKPIQIGACFTDKTGKMWIRLTNRDAIIDFSSHALSLSNFLPGEPMEYSLVPRDRNNKNIYALAIFPNPLEIKDQHGRKITMKILTPDLQSFAFELTDFQPNEKVKTISISSDEIMPNQRAVGENGTMTCIIHPAVIGKRRGSATFKIIPVATGEAMEINYDWGFPK